MAPGELVQQLMSRLSEARLCMEQGLGHGTAEILKGILAEIEEKDFPESAREEIRSRTESMLNSLNDQGTTENAPKEGFHATDPIQFYNYGSALMDGQFWEEAIQQLSMAAGLGCHRLKCWELCGDCASRLEKWEDAFRFYEYVYSDESLTDEQKKAILTKITKCSQAQKKKHARCTPPAEECTETQAAAQGEKPEFVNPSILSLGSYSVDPIIGQTVSSWAGPAGKTLTAISHRYRVTDLLHVGSSSLVVELEDQSDRKKYAGQTLSGKLANALPREKLALWAQRQMLVNSRHLVRIYDLATVNGYFFIVREYLPLSLNDLLTAGGNMPISLAVRFAYQVLEALGDLHLHMAADGRIQSLFHLDLRPSRVLLCRDKPQAQAV